ncbi:hemerythrin [Achromatium sp. WMS3]|nr:hemerythrin [Achromatium sp. WMS3]
MAQFLEWSEEISVGVEEIDEQHKVLVKLINDLNDAMQERRSNEIVKEILNKLAEYTRIHFAVEESLMRILGYPGYEAHKAQHQELIYSVLDLAQKVEGGKSGISFELMHFLKSWLTKHIMESDKDYSDHFLKAGIQSKLKKRSWIFGLWE